ncbi:MAG: YjzC family protein [Defluviitaleaceae bacterium]|nr:YjzC family protein [Defluviitaleaceae bacterium]
MPKKSPLVSGMDAPKRGTYTEIGPRGGVKGDVTMKKRGDTMPPTELPNSQFKKK